MPEADVSWPVRGGVRRVRREADSAAAGQVDEGRGRPHQVVQGREVLSSKAGRQEGREGSFRMDGNRQEECSGDAEFGLMAEGGRSDNPLLTLAATRRRSLSMRRRARAAAWLRACWKGSSDVEEEEAGPMLLSLAGREAGQPLALEASCLPPLRAAGGGRATGVRAKVGMASRSAGIAAMQQAGRQVVGKRVARAPSPTQLRG